MMDMMSILLVFLLKQFSVESAQLNVSVMSPVSDGFWRLVIPA